MVVGTKLVKILTELIEWQRSYVVRCGDDPERGDVPGWVFVTLMSAALVGVLYLVAAPALSKLLGDALDNFQP